MRGEKDEDVPVSSASAPLKPTAFTCTTNNAIREKEMDNTVAVEVAVPVLAR